MPDSGGGYFDNALLDRPWGKPERQYRGLDRRDGALQISSALKTEGFDVEVALAELVSVEDTIGPPGERQSDYEKRLGQPVT
jgi:hypothetical protein